MNNEVKGIIYSLWESHVGMDRPVKKIARPVRSDDFFMRRKGLEPFFIYIKPCKYAILEKS